MAKKCYIGVDGTARRVKKGYIGVGDISHKIKKAYIGVGGVARPCWSGGTPAYYGTVTPLSSIKAVVASKAGNYALFLKNQEINAYAPSLTRTLAEAPRSNTEQSGHVGQYALMTTSNNGMDAYDAELTRTNAPNVSLYKGYLYQLPNNRSYMLYPGGYGNPGSGYQWVTGVEAYDAQLVKHTAPNQSVGRGWLVDGGTTDEYAMVVGGAYYTNIDAYDTDLTHILANMQIPRRGGQCCAIGSYLLIPGGMNSADSVTSTVEVCDRDLTCTYVDPLSAARMTGAASLDGSHVVCTGADARVDLYDDNLVHTAGATMKTTRDVYPSGNEAGIFALFAGGDSTTAVEAYTLV